MITANDIRTSVFSRAGRGYKIQDVDDFLEEAAVSMEQLQKEIIILMNIGVFMNFSIVKRVMRRLTLRYS